MTIPERQIETIQDIRGAFSKKEITAREAASLIGEVSVKKPWHTKEWVIERNRLIEDACTQCGSQKPPLVLQHTWQPQKLSRIAQEIRQNLLPDYERQHPFPQLTPPEPEWQREGCPRCHKFSFYWRKTTEDWRCANQHCKHVFENPVNVPILSPHQQAEWYPVVEAAEEKWKLEFRETTEEQVLAEALQITFAEHDRYISLKDTTTFCKKCAFLWDIKGKRMCSKCRSFIPIHLDESYCFTCLDKVFGEPLRHIEAMYAAEARRNKWYLYDPQITRKEPRDDRERPEIL